LVLHHHDRSRPSGHGRHIAPGRIISGLGLFSCSVGNLGRFDAEVTTDGSRKIALTTGFDVPATAAVGEGGELPAAARFDHATEARELAGHEAGSKEAIAGRNPGD
jgi:hypothetical protein